MAAVQRRRGGPGRARRALRTAPSLVGEGELALLAFTDLAALLIASMMRGQQQSELAAQLQTALDSRTVIEQAKGVLIGQQGMSPRAAYELLRARARSQRRKLSAVSADVVRSAANSG